MNSTDDGAEERPEKILQTETAAKRFAVVEDDQAGKILLTASMHEIVNPPNLPRPEPQEGPMPWVEFGLVHHYRTRYFNGGLVTGPFEQVLTVGPQETVEVGIEVSRRTTLEEENEAKFQLTTEQESTSGVTSEFTDRISSVIQKTSSSSASMSVSGSVGVFGGTASGSLNQSEMRTDSKEQVRRTVKEATQRISQQVMKSQVFRTRRTEEVTSRDYFRRLINNTSDEPRHFALRRLQQRHRAVTQLRGPRLVWLVPVPDPGRALGVPRIVTSSALPSLALQAGARETRTIEPFTLLETVQFNRAAGAPAWPIQFRILNGYRLLAAQFKNGRQSIQVRRDGQDASGTWSFQGFARIARIDPVAGSGNSFSVIVQVTPGQLEGNVPQTFQLRLPEVVIIAVDETLEMVTSKPDDLQEFLAAYREVISEARALKPRPSGDLRREERDEVVARSFDQLNLKDTSNDSGDVALVSRIFDLDGTFYQLMPPFVQAAEQGFGFGVSERRQYDTYAELPAAPLGSSIGWKIQADGDARRNEFINSALARVCIPVQRGFERIASELIASRMQADVSAPSTEVINYLELRWERERHADAIRASEDLVDTTRLSRALDEASVPDAELAEALFPVVDLFPVNEPLEGFIYQPIELP